MDKLKITHNKEWGEYCVEYLLNGVKNEDKSYYTDDKQDAKETMKAMQLEFDECPGSCRH